MVLLITPFEKSIGRSNLTQGFLTPRQVEGHVTEAMAPSKGQEQGYTHNQVLKFEIGVAS